MANWDKTYREAVKTQQHADLLFEQADAQQCGFTVAVGSFAERRCIRDTDHSGVHHIDNYEG